ncbi:MAG TPA: hypothetical protein DCY88_21070 [Cyanobacteria bacterium UBA11372]|nr:hypothetical protein [Cyanobacteria bacterium UBA11372]
MLTIAFSPVLSLGLVNLAVDPYGVISTPTIAKFNQSKPEILTQERMYKAVEITRLKPQIILLGSSRTQWGIYPQHPGLSKSNLKAYNVGFSGANMYEVMRYFKHAIANQPDLKTVVIGLDFFMFREHNPPASDFRESRLEITSIHPQDLINSLFSVDALIASQKTITKNISLSYPNYQIYNGFFINDYRKPLPGSSQAFAKWIKPAFNAYRNYKLSPQNLNHLKNIIQVCQQKGIDVKVFISPSHAIEAEAIQIVGSWEQFEQWKRELVKITPVWDFSGYNSITGESIKTEMKNYTDNSHYRKEVGDLILNRLFDSNTEKVPNDFGILLTPKNIQSHLAKIRADREFWAKNNPNDVKLMQNLKLNLYK